MATRNADTFTEVTGSSNSGTSQSGGDADTSVFSGADSGTVMTGVLAKATPTGWPIRILQPINPDLR
jgi:hypothetical protein